ncbi:MAG: hypothetical protein HYW57_06540 [Ignavibacteriales bacterium]|nr:hypothetical protein [Ignavibacteriales bacterium]
MAYVAFENFSKSNVESTRDAMKDEIASLTREALNYYNRPSHLGGGGFSFYKFNDVRRKKVNPRGRKPAKGETLWESENGVYTVVATAKDSLVVDGVGDCLGNDGKNPIWVRVSSKPTTPIFSS